MAITEFKDQYSFLSNFWFTPEPIRIDSYLFPTVEHAYQASKSLNPIDYAAIEAMSTPGMAKRYGKKIQLRDDWDRVKLRIMFNLLQQKFNQPQMKHLLLETGNQKLIEGNRWHDNIWGRCMCDGCEYDRLHHTITSHNWLGRLLVHVRTELQIEEYSNGNLHILH